MTCKGISIINKFGIYKKSNLVVKIHFQQSLLRKSEVELEIELNKSFGQLIQSQLKNY